VLVKNSVSDLYSDIVKVLETCVVIYFSWGQFEIDMLFAMG
jgi:hypothetical protein